MLLLMCYLLLGCMVGFLAGLMGVGGGMIIVPALLFIFTHFVGLDGSIAMHLAIGTSLATIILTAAFTTHAHHKKGAVLWPIFWAFAPGVILGALILGPIIANYLSGQWLRLIFAIFCVIMAIQMVMTMKNNDIVASLENRHFFSPAIIIGVLSSLLGVAGGSLAAMLLNWYRCSMRNIIGTTAAIGLPVAICGTIGFIVTGWHVTGLPKWSSGYIYWPAFVGIVLGSACTSRLGASLAHKLPVAHLKRIFAIMLIVIAVQLIFN